MRLTNITLDSICRIMEWTAIITLFLGIVASLYCGIHKESNDIIFEWEIIIGGIVASFTNTLFLLFMSRIGDAIDDMRNKYVYTNNDE